MNNSNNINSIYIYYNYYTYNIIYIYTGYYKPYIGKIILGTSSRWHGMQPGTFKIELLAMDHLHKMKIEKHTYGFYSKWCKNLFRKPSDPKLGISGVSRIQEDPCPDLAPSMWRTTDLICN